MSTPTGNNSLRQHIVQTQRPHTAIVSSATLIALMEEGRTLLLLSSSVPSMSSASRRMSLLQLPPPLAEVPAASCRLPPYIAPQSSTAVQGRAEQGKAWQGRAAHAWDSTAQHSTAQHSTAQHSTAQHSTARHITAQPGPAQPRMKQQLSPTLQWDTSYYKLGRARQTTVANDVHESSCQCKSGH